jgi:hypothetical protein
MTFSRKLQWIQYLLALMFYSRCFTPAACHQWWLGSAEDASVNHSESSVFHGEHSTANMANEVTVSPSDTILMRIMRDNTDTGDTTRAIFTKAGRKLLHHRRSQCRSHSSIPLFPLDFRDFAVCMCYSDGSRRYQFCALHHILTSCNILCC